jgi:hypothetical protein
MPDDLAVSSSYSLESRVLTAIVFGSNKTQREDIIRRLERVYLTDVHPLLLPGIVAELERCRLVKGVDELLDAFAFRASSDQELDLDMDKVKMASSLKLCFESRDLVIQMNTEKRKLAQMTTWINQFGDALSLIDPCYLSGVTPLGPMISSGCQIKTRLDEMSQEYDDKTKECDLIIKNMSLTMQTVRESAFLSTADSSY